MNAIKLLKNDHRHVQKLVAAFTKDAGGRRSEILIEIIRELSIHAALEEAYLYPLIRDVAPGGGALLEADVREHQRLKEVLARLDGAVGLANTREVKHEVKLLSVDLTHHVAEEENEFFPALKKAVPKATLKAVGRSMRDAARTAPTRPHPHQGPATQFSAWANGLVDHVRDRVVGRVADS